MLRREFGFTYRQALSMARVPPTLLFAPFEAAESSEKKATIAVAE
jgi:hypothetical protein